jgi:hypothetical protein
MSQPPVSAAQAVIPPQLTSAAAWQMLHSPPLLATQLSSPPPTIALPQPPPGATSLLSQPTPSQLYPSETLQLLQYHSQLHFTMVSQMSIAHAEQLRELRSINEILYGTVKAMTVSQASDQRTIAELNARLQEGDVDDDPLSLLELLELRRWKKLLCESETRSLISRVEESWSREAEVTKRLMDVQTEMDALRAKVVM